MDAQLHLIPEVTPQADGDRPVRDVNWRLDDSTRAVGRRGIQQARAALRSAARHRAVGPDEGHATAA
jgi:hypothetical protein